MRSRFARSVWLASCSLFVLAVAGCPMANPERAVELKLSASPDPVPYGGWVDLLVQARNLNAPLADARVALWSSQGEFAATGKMRVEGTTDAAGEFRARYRRQTWVATPNYEITVDLEKAGTNGGYRVWTIAVNDPGPQPQSGETLQCFPNVTAKTVAGNQPTWVEVEVTNHEGKAVPFAQVEVTAPAGFFNGAPSPHRGSTDLDGRMKVPWTAGGAKGSFTLNMRVSKPGWTSWSGNLPAVTAQ
jgi:hypothetical protein